MSITKKIFNGLFVLTRTFLQMCFNPATKYIAIVIDTGLVNILSTSIQTSIESPYTDNNAYRFKCMLGVALLNKVDEIHKSILKTSHTIYLQILYSYIPIIYYNGDLVVGWSVCSASGMFCVRIQAATKLSYKCR